MTRGALGKAGNLPSAGPGLLLPSTSAPLLVKERHRHHCLVVKRDPGHLLYPLPIIRLLPPGLEHVLWRVLLRFWKGI